MSLIEKWWKSRKKDSVPEENVTEIAAEAVETEDNATAAAFTAPSADTNAADTISADSTSADSTSADMTSAEEPAAEKTPADSAAAKDAAADPAVVKVETVEEAAAEKAEAVEEAVVEKTDAVEEAAAEKAEAVEAKLADQAEVLEEKVSGKIQGVEEAVEKAVEKAEEALKEEAQAVKADAAETTAETQESLEEAAQEAKTFVDETKEVLEGAVEDSTETVKEFEEAVEEAEEEAAEAEEAAEFVAEEVAAEEVEEEAVVNEAAAEETVEAADTAIEEDAVQETEETEEAVVEAVEETIVVAEESGKQETVIAAEVDEAIESPLDALQPKDVFKYFRQIAAIPHGSYNTAALSNYLENFAKEHDFACIRDEMGNVIISRPGSAGYENADPIALQGHIDMVCEKHADNPIDMEHEAITLDTDGEWLWAKGTTLGGDDGIAVAIMLALLADETLTCPPLECVFTVDEEVGLLGASFLDLSELKSRRMINLDSESEGVITASCAGGAEVVCTMSGKRREKKGEVLEVSISGLRGGHSGERINCGRANADILLARLLYSLQENGKYCIIGFNGGLRDNAIPRDAKAEIIFTGIIKRNEIKQAIAAFAADIAREYSVTDPDIRIRAKWVNKGKRDRRIAFTRKDSYRMIRFLLALPNGLIEVNPIYTDVPQTSLSMGIVKTMADGMQIHSMVRSSINSQKKMLLDQIACIAEEFGADMDLHGTYPAWELIEKSDFRDLAAEVYEQVTGIAPTVCVIHGGLECGLLAAKVSGLDCISLGPDMEEVHTPAERLNIPSSERTYNYIKALLEACAKA